MTQNAEFLSAIKAIADGEKNAVARLRQFLDDNQQTTTQRQWLLNIYREANSEPLISFETAEKQFALNEDLISEIVRLLDKLEMPRASYSVAPNDYDDFHLDTVRTRKRGELGLGRDSTHEKQPSRDMSSALAESGWISLYALSITLGVSNSNVLFKKKLQVFVEELGLEKHIIQFQAGQFVYTYISPELRALCVESADQFKPKTLENMRPGERVKSVFQDSAGKFQLLLMAITSHLEAEGLSAELALVTRNPARGSGNTPVCLTTVCQKILHDHRIIRISSDNINRNVSVLTRNIPKGDDEYKALVKTICEEIRMLAAKDYERPDLSANPGDETGAKFVRRISKGDDLTPRR